MTSETHNKLVAALNLLYGVFRLVIAILTMVMLPRAFKSQGTFPPEFRGGMIAFATIGFTLWSLMYAIPALVAGYALLRGVRWARIAALAAASMGALDIPLGLIPGVFTVWFVFSKKGKSLYADDVMARSTGY